MHRNTCIAILIISTGLAAYFGIYETTHSIFDPIAPPAGRALSPTPLNDKFTDRLEKLTKELAVEDGMALRFLVAMNPDPNAYAVDNSTIRVNSGLMKVMDDNELMWIIGHEIGHIKLGHVTNAKGSTSENYLPRHEQQADDYALAFMERHHINKAAAPSALSKLAKQDPSLTMFKTHPSAQSRLEHMQNQK